MDLARWSTRRRCLRHLPPAVAASSSSSRPHHQHGHAPPRCRSLLLPSMATAEVPDTTTPEIEGLADTPSPRGAAGRRSTDASGPSPLKHKRRRQRRRAGTLTADEGRENRWQTAAGSWGAWRRQHHNNNAVSQVYNQKCRSIW